MSDQDLNDSIKYLEVTDLNESAGGLSFEVIDRSVVPVNTSTTTTTTTAADIVNSPVSKFRRSNNGDQAPSTPGSSSFGSQRGFRPPRLPSSVSRLSDSSCSNVSPASLSERLHNAAVRHGALVAVNQMLAKDCGSTKVEECRKRKMSMEKSFSEVTAKSLTEKMDQAKELRELALQQKQHTARRSIDRVAQATMKRLRENEIAREKYESASEKRHSASKDKREKLADELHQKLIKRHDHVKRVSGARKSLDKSDSSSANQPVFGYEVPEDENQENEPGVKDSDDDGAQNNGTTSAPSGKSEKADDKLAKDKSQ